MVVEARFRGDVETILSHRHDQGADLWTTPDRRLIKGAPFSTLECVDYLLDLGVEPTDPVITAAVELLLSTWKDGRFHLSPKGAVLPCHTAAAARTLAYAGLTNDPRVQQTLRLLLDTQFDDGGWRCNKFPFGHGPGTEYSNPHPTLMALDAFRLSQFAGNEAALDRAVDFLLHHWDLKVPIGPCRYGIGTLFMQVEYPFRSYNLFYWVYVLSHYERARSDARFCAAADALSSRTQNGQIVVHRVVPKLARLTFCEKGRPSTLATYRYHEILRNIG